MVIWITCDRCGKVLNEPGGLVFSPMVGDNSTTTKRHVCTDCWPSFELMFKALKETK